MSSTAEPNPYESSGIVRSDVEVKPAGQSLPTFCRIVFMVDCCFCVIRGILVFVGLAGLAELADLASRRNSTFTEAYHVVIYELAFSAGIAIFGTSGNIAMLLKKDWGKYLGFLNVFATVGALFCAYIQMNFAILLVNVRPQRLGMIAGFTAVVAARLVLLGFFIAALVIFSKWKRQQSELLNQLISKYLR